MKIERPPLKCYVAAIRNAAIDAVLGDKGFSSGLIAFAVPAYGVLYRGRAEGSLLDLEFGAFFALLEFIDNNLEPGTVNSINVISSDPRVVFAFDDNSQLFLDNPERRMLLQVFNSKYKLSMSYLESMANRALWSPLEYPSLRQANTIRLDKIEKDFLGSRFMPFQKGTRL